MVSKQLTLRLSDSLIYKIKEKAKTLKVSVNTLSATLFESSVGNEDFMSTIEEKIEVIKLHKKPRKERVVNHGMKKVCLCYPLNGKNINNMVMLANIPRINEFVTVDFKEYREIKVSHDILYPDSVDVFLG
ncbi:hypothetical protein FOE33_24455 [Salmonella enterica]|nr:hypothetical protein [Salmonella enterica]ECH4042233.1 hypothetical protein [Salmonella enterica]